jgi:hypothetical protein
MLFQLKIEKLKSLKIKEKQNWEKSKWKCLALNSAVTLNALLSDPSPTLSQRCSSASVRFLGIFLKDEL